MLAREVVVDLPIADADRSSLVPPLPAPNLRSARVVPLPLCSEGLGLIDPCREDTQGFGLVLVLAALGLAFGGDPGGSVECPHGAVGGIPVLAALPVAPLRLKLDVGVGEVEGCGRFWQDGHGHSAGLDTAASFGRRDALPPMATSLVLERLDGGRTADADCDRA